MPKLICHKIINRDYNDVPASYFENIKTRELVAGKFFWATLRRNIENYIKKYDMYFTFQIVRYKPYGGF